MNSGTVKLVGTHGGMKDEPVDAVFVLDAGGGIVAANATARDLLDVETKRLMGAPFVGLFQSQPISDPDSLREQWNDLRQHSGGGWFEIEAKLSEGSSRPMRLQLERSVGGAGSYIATVRT